MLAVKAFPSLSRAVAKNRESIMSFKRPTPVVLAMCLLGAFAGAPLHAADTSINPGAAAVNVAPVVFVAGKRSGEKKNSADVGHLKTDPGARMQVKGNGRRISGEKARRRERTQSRKISTYSLFHDPLFKSHTAAIAPYRSGAASTIRNLDTGVVGGTTGQANFMAQQPESASTVFDCGEKSFFDSARRELTACYVHRVDKTWKTRTYVTKGLADSNPGWGGGLSIGYAY